MLGGASTVGLAAGGPGLAWPARLSSALAEKFPSARIKVVNLAVARQTAKAAAERLVRDVLPLKPTLVIWETGTMEAVRGSTSTSSGRRCRPALTNSAPPGPRWC